METVQNLGVLTPRAGMDGGPTARRQRDPAQASRWRSRSEPSASNERPVVTSACVAVRSFAGATATARVISVTAVEIGSSSLPRRGVIDDDIGLSANMAVSRSRNSRDTFRAATAANSLLLATPSSVTNVSPMRSRARATWPCHKRQRIRSMISTRSAPVWRSSGGDHRPAFGRPDQHGESASER